MTYIIYIKTQINYYFIKFIDKGKVNIIAEAILKGKNDFILDGKKYFINRLLEIRIFETESESKFHEDIKNSGIKIDRDWVNVDGQNKGYYKPDMLCKIIKEVTTEFIGNKEVNLEIKTPEKIEKTLNSDNKSKDIFISHSSKDKILIDKFVEKILILGLNLSKDDIFCTSTEGFGIKTGDDFRNAIKENISNAKITLLLISPNYKKSEICLNEMGAAWALNSHVLPVIIDPIDYKSVGVILEPLQIAKVNDSMFLDELSKIILKTLNKNNFDIVTWNKHKQEFIDFSNSYIQLLKTTDDKFPSEYFEQFLIKNIDIDQILIEAHPTKLDCQRLFSEKFSDDAFIRYCKIFSQFGKEKAINLWGKYTTYKISSATVFELLKGSNYFNGGTIECVKNYVFNIDQKLYRVDFLENETGEGGYSFEIFTYYNNRVVFFPKPYRLGLIK